LFLHQKRQLYKLSTHLRRPLPSQKHHNQNLSVRLPLVKVE
jgi:hypothetical protein